MNTNLRTGVFRVFCKQCASPLYSRRSQMPELLRLRIGTLDSKIHSKPSSHIFVGSKAEWYEICDDIPQYQERPTV
ncbi:GFA family protein [Marinomonas rhodophyticola]|uniref:GFA family protein n=1 Tax=Marinomonas rhodophyticola TaxID=2992803 RepID=A0ABT3KD80_9GAMM|nr:GFA family protein [Marinomonas sp. KJ51-3]